MEKIAFHVPVPLLEQAREIQAHEGWAEAELHRLFWEAGFAAHAEKSNKRLVNKKLRNEQQSPPSSSEDDGDLVSDR